MRRPVRGPLVPAPCFDIRHDEKVQSLVARDGIKAGAIGTVLAMSSKGYTATAGSPSGRSYLVKWKGRRWPLAMQREEIARPDPPAG